MTYCLIVQPIHPAGLEALAAAGIEARMASAPDMGSVAREIADAHSVITRNAGLDAAAIRAAPRLEVIANHGIGTNRIDVALATALAIPVVYTPTANARSTAEHAVALLVALAKRVVASDREVRAGHWDYRYTPGFAELHGKVLGVVGFGTIGRIVAEIAGRGFGMRVLVWSPAAADADIAAAGAARAATLDALLAAADAVSLHRPFRPDTRHTLDARAFERMKRSALVVNTARAELIDDAALTDALTRGRIAGAALDVFEREPLPGDAPLRNAPNLVLTPHVAGGTDEALRETALQCAAQIADVLAGRRPPHLVNPQVWDARRRP